MKDQVAVIFGTNQLGGAERSLIEQFSFVKGEDYSYFYPKLELSDSDFLKFMKSKGLQKHYPYHYPSFLYKISRKNLLKFSFLGLPSIISSIFKWNNLFKRFSKFYVNGNKAAFPVLAWATIFRKTPTMYWHMRDFPSSKAFFTIAWLIKKFKPEKMNIKFIANSQAVARELQVFFPQADIECIYNLAGDLPHRNIEKIKRIGVVAMFAPWKGLHEVLWMALFYEKELKAMGIEGISFYGADIYQTDGEHVLYFNQLKALNGKISPGFVEWRGKKSPSDIFSEIDLLVHSSILPEPFGRVIIEAFKSGIPVISTGLGGAAELLEGNKFGLTYQVHEYTELYKAIQSSCLNLSVTSLRNSAAFEISSLLEIHTKNKIRSIL